MAPAPSTAGVFEEYEPMLGRRQLLGKSGEAKAAKYLKKCGFSIVRKNYSCKHGEIDLIAQDGEILVFIEVKTRSQQSFGCPASAVNPRKQMQISKVAHHYMVEQQTGDMDARFDVISVLMLKGEKPVIDHIPDAFEFTLY